MSASTTLGAPKARRKKAAPVALAQCNVTKLHAVKMTRDAAKASQYQSDLIDVLTCLLEDAKAGELVGLVWCDEKAGDEHRLGIVGSYEKTRMSAVGAAAAVYRLVEKAVNGDLEGFKRRR